MVGAAPQALLLCGQPTVASSSLALVALRAVVSLATYYGLVNIWTPLAVLSVPDTVTVLKRPLEHHQEVYAVVLTSPNLYLPHLAVPCVALASGAAEPSTTAGQA